MHRFSHVLLTEIFQFSPYISQIMSHGRQFFSPRYLSEELHLSQVEVNTGEGIVRLTQISLDCEVLNEELNNLLVDKDTSTAKPPPVRIAAVNIRELTAHISYSTILTESCHFIASGVEVVIIPTDRTSAPTSSHVHSQDNDESFDTKRDSNNSNHPLKEENNFFGMLFILQHIH